MTSPDRTTPIESEPARPPGAWRWVWAAPVGVAVLLAAWSEKPILGGLLAAAGGFLVPLIWGRLVSGLRTMVAEVAATGRLRGLGVRLVWAVLLPAACLGALAVTAGLGKWLLEDRDIMRWCTVAGVGLGTLVVVLRSAWQAGRGSGGNVHRDASPVLIAAVLAAYVVTWMVATRWFTGPEFVLHAAVVAGAYMSGQAASLLCWRRFMFAADALAAPLALTAAAVSYLAHDMGRLLFHDDAWSSLLAALLAFLLAWPVGHLAAVAIWGATGWVARSVPWIAQVSRRLPFAWREVAWCPAAPARAAAGRRRPFQFGLRTLLVVTIVLGLLSGWVGRYVKRARDQQAAVDAILKLGGTVTYEGGRPAGDRLPGLAVNTEAPGPKWARDLLGENFFSSVSEVYYPETAGDEDLVYLEKLRGLKHLDLCCPNVTDAGLEHLHGLTNLKSLSIFGASITGRGLAHLRDASELEELTLLACGITDAGLAPVAEMRNLRNLDLTATQITDAGLAHLSGLKKLEDLSLTFTSIKGPGLVHLERLTQLKVVSLENTQVTAVAVQRLEAALPDTHVASDLWTAILPPLPPASTPPPEELDEGAPEPQRADP